jgi:hypothetical protein
MSEPRDARTAACVSTAWLILINKPMYPIYVWALLGPDAASRSLATVAPGFERETLAADRTLKLHFAAIVDAE